MTWFVVQVGVKMRRKDVFELCVRKLPTTISFLSSIIAFATLTLIATIYSFVNHHFTEHIVIFINIFIILSIYIIIEQKNKLESVKSMLNQQQIEPIQNTNSAQHQHLHHHMMNNAHITIPLSLHNIQVKSLTIVIIESKKYQCFLH